MAEKVLPGGNAQPNAPLTSKVPENAQDYDPAKSRVTDPTEVTTRLDQIYQSLFECMVQSDKVLQPYSVMENHPTTQFPLGLTRQRWDMSKRL